MQLTSTQGRAYLSCALTGVEEPRKGTIESFNVSLRDAAVRLGIAVYLPQEASSPDHEDDLTPSEVYVLDRLRIAESDVVVADLDRPSFGVGQEIEMACSMGIPVIGYHLAGGRVSRMVLGQPGLYRDSGDSVPTPIQYAERQAPGALHQDELIREILRRVAHVRKSAERITAKGSRETSFGVILKAARVEAGFTTERLSTLSGVPAGVIEMIEMTQLDLDALVKKTRRPSLGPIDFEKFQSTSRFVLHQLQDALNVKESDHADLGALSNFGLAETAPPPKANGPRVGMLTDLLGPATDDPDRPAPVAVRPAGDFSPHEFENGLNDLFTEQGVTYAEMLEVSQSVGFEVAFNARIHLNRDGVGGEVERARQALAAIRARDDASQPRDAE